LALQLLLIPLLLVVQCIHLSHTYKICLQLFLDFSLTSLVSLLSFKDCHCLFGIYHFKNGLVKGDWWTDALVTCCLRYLLSGLSLETVLH